MYKYRTSSIASAVLAWLGHCASGTGVIFGCDDPCREIDKKPARRRSMDNAHLKWALSLVSGINQNLQREKAEPEGSEQANAHVELDW